MKQKLFLLFFFIRVSTGFCAPSLTPEESAILNVFFKYLIQDFPAGYVLYDSKPICKHFIGQGNFLFPDAPCHLSTVALREGFILWNKLSPKSKNFLIHSHPKAIFDQTEILFINRKLVLDTIRKNSPLFQYILGPKVTPKRLLESIISSEKSLDIVLNENNVLMGILLGYGTTNSIYESRVEYIYDIGEIPPFQNAIKNIPELYQEQKGRLLLDPHLKSIRDNGMEPSFGFETLQEEYNTLSKELEVSSDKFPNFVCGWLPKQRATKNLILKLEKAQAKINDLLKSPTFLSDVMELATGEKYLVNQQENFKLPIAVNERENINLIAAKEIWSIIHTFPPEATSSFMHAFENPNESFEEMDSGFEYLSDYKKVILTSKTNLEEANKLFEKLAQDTTFKAIMPQKLYYKVLEKGQGNELCDETLVTLKYQIFDPHNVGMTNRQFALHDSEIDLSRTIPGFAHGIKGMRVGETREIYIHPSLAYGLETSLERGIYLRAIVTLVEIQDHPKKMYTTLKSEDLSFIFDSKFEKECEKKCEFLGKFYGKRVADYLAKSDILDLQVVKKNLRELYKKNTTNEPLTEAEKRAMNRIHWNILFRKPV